MSDGDDFTGTMPVREQHKFDTHRLADWMRLNVSGFHGALTVEQFKGGQSNPTFRLKAGADTFVLRRKPPGKLLPSAHAVDREYRVISALAATDVPVAHAIALCIDDDVIGTPFYLMEWVEGRIFWDAALPGLSPADRAAIYDAMNDAIACLHRVDYAALGLTDFGRPGHYIRRQIERWTKQYRASEIEPIEAMDRLIDWLPAHAPDDSGTSVVHGDYRIDNLIFHPTEPKVRAVLDWELSTLGDPIGDFAYHMMSWHLAPPIFRGLADRDLAALGIPGEDAYRQAYCRRTGRDGIFNWDFYLIYNMFRLSAILQGVMARAVQGTAASASAHEQGAKARAIAAAAWARVVALES